jgi:hypothetical protein
MLGIRLPVRLGWGVQAEQGDEVWKDEGMRRVVHDWLPVVRGRMPAGADLSGEMVTLVRGARQGESVLFPEFLRSPVTGQILPREPEQPVVATPAAHPGWEVAPNVEQNLFRSFDAERGSAAELTGDAPQDRIE